MGIVVIGAIFVDIKGFPEDNYIPTGRNVGRVEYIHGGVCRNVAEDIANIELNPTLLSIIDDTSMGEEVLKKLQKHRVNTDYILVRPGGMGTWLVVFNNNGDVAGSISQRADMMPLLQVLEENGDEIISKADSIVLQADLNKDIIKKTLALAEKYEKKVYTVVTNMSLAAERRDLLQKTDCIVCNQLEAGIFFADDYCGRTHEEMEEIILQRVQAGKLPAMVVTLGENGAVYATEDGKSGYCPANHVQVKDTTGAGDAFFSGVAIGLTYGKTMEESVQIGTNLAASVIISSENVCPRFLPRELGIDMDPVVPPDKE